MVFAELRILQTRGPTGFGARLTALRIGPERLLLRRAALLMGYWTESRKLSTEKFRYFQRTVGRTIKAGRIGEAVCDFCPTLLGMFGIDVTLGGTLGTKVV